MKLIIKSFCKIKNSIVYKDGKEIFSAPENLSSPKFFEQFYKNRINNYPKFYKMDNLSKLAFITADTVISGTTVLQDYSGSMCGLVIGNSSSSIQTDRKYYETIIDRNAYFPSPALFVYTLPNIMLGEICIRYKISGENLLIISKENANKTLADYVEVLFAKDCIKCCLAGWVEYNENNPVSFMTLVELENNENSKDLCFTEESLNRIINEEEF